MSLKHGRTYKNSKWPIIRVLPFKAPANVVIAVMMIILTVFFFTWCYGSGFKLFESMSCYHVTSYLWDGEKVYFSFVANLMTIIVKSSFE